MGASRKGEHAWNTDRAAASLWAMDTARTLRRALLAAACIAAALPTAGRASGSDLESGPAAGFTAFLSGRFAVSQGDFATGADDFLAALQSDPTDPELIRQAFVSTVLTDRPEAVHLARLLPDDQAAQLLVGAQDALNGRWDAARKVYAGLSRDGMVGLVQPLLVAWSEAGAGQVHAAIAGLRPAIDKPHGRIRALYALHAAMIADLAGHHAEADRLYRIAQEAKAPPDLRRAEILASWQARRGHGAEADATIAGLLRDSPDLAVAVPAIERAAATPPVARATDGLAETYLSLAAAMHAQDADDYAMMVLHMALHLRPGLTPARLLLADIDDQNGGTQAALAVLSEVPASDPLDAAVRLRRAGLEDEAGDTATAIAGLEQLGRQYPTQPGPLQALGDLLKDHGRYAAAAKAYDQAIGRLQHPDAADWVLYYDRGVALERSHHWPQAQADLEHALQLAPDQPFVLNYLGYYWADHDQHLTRARQMIERAVEARPNDGNLVDSLGWVELRQGDVKGAVRELERAAEMSPEDSTINGHLGDAYWAAGWRLEAEYQWRRALTLNPEPDDAARLEAELQRDTPKATATPQGTAAAAERRIQ